jgi:hypothetical protein
VPRDLPTTRAGLLPRALSAALGDRIAYHRLLEALSRYALVTADPDGSAMDRLVQARGRYRQAEPLARRALALARTAPGPEDAETAWRHHELGPDHRQTRDIRGRLDRQAELEAAAGGA